MYTRQDLEYVNESGYDEYLWHRAQELAETYQLPEIIELALASGLDDSNEGLSLGHSSRNNPAYIIEPDKLHQWLIEYLFQDLTENGEF